jgi:tetratricopeptide (TPR) repeat protein
LLILIPEGELIMLKSQNCPRCLQPIKNDRLRGSPIVCNSCGHVLSPTQKASEEGMERSFLYIIIASAVFMVASFIHLANWGGASFEVVGFKLGELIGTNSTQTVERMAKTCLELKKFECTEKMYGQLARGDAKQFVRLGKFQLSQRKFKDASDSFRRFFSAGGGDIEVNYLYAKALGELGAIEEASRHFDYVLAAKPDVVQITVVQNYVKYLMSANKLDHAKDVIHKVRRRDTAVSSFMENELNAIIQRQGGKA